MPLSTLTPGTTFARDFLVEALVAEGGMGAVYRAEQRSTGNAVALKIMLPELLVDPKSRERFEHEARISGRIKSSHVVKVLAAGIDDATQTPWLAMEFLEGESLAAFARKHGALAPTVVLAILQQVGHALAAAHAVGVVHCDLKPENVFIAESQSVGVPFDVKVLDFGIARIVKEGRQSATVTTAVGSPHWLAPEQGATGRTVSAGTDLWSLGLIAFWLLTGRSYWLNANVAAGEYNMYSLLGEIAGRDPIVPASERLRALGETQALLPAGFDAWFARCVDRDVNRRFAGAREAVDGLTAALSFAGNDVYPTARPSLPSAPIAPTSQLTIGVAGLAPPGHPAVGPSVPSGNWSQPPLPAPASKHGPVLAMAVVATAALCFGGWMAFKRHSTTPAKVASPVAAAPATTAQDTTAPATPAPATPVPTHSALLTDVGAQAIEATLRAGEVGSPVWIAVAAIDPSAEALGVQLNEIFARAGWRTHPIQHPTMRARPGVFLFSWTESPPPYVDTVQRALEAGGLRPSMASGYRTFITQRLRQEPTFQGLTFEPGQTFVIAIGRGE